MHRVQGASWWVVHGCACGNIRRAVRLGEKELSKHVHSLLPTREVEECGVTEVLDFIRGACISSRWVADGLVSGMNSVCVSGNER